MHRSFFAGFASAALIFVSSSARADEPGTPTQPPVVVAAPPPAPVPSYAQYQRHRYESANVWYGWQTLTADGASSVLGIALSRADNNLGAAVAGVGYLLGGPVVHWAHGNLTKGFASLGVRIAMPLVLGLVGYGLGSVGDHGSGNDSAAIGGALGITLGVGGAIAIDAAVIAREKRHPDEDEDHANDGQTPAFHAAAPKGLFVPGSLSPIVQPQKSIPGSQQITGAVFGVSAALF